MESDAFKNIIHYKPTVGSRRGSITRLLGFFVGVTMNSKTCTKCGETKPATKDHFWREVSGKYGLRGDCKLCASNRQSRANYYNELRKNNQSYKLYKSLQTLLSNTMSGRTKKCKTFKYIGCSVVELKSHLENQFKDGMSWENYGKWHIDHITPRSHFDHNNESEIFKCWHYTNLQPLWASENIKKGNRIKS